MVVALLTEDRYESPRPDDLATPYVANIIEEDSILSAALGEQGIESQRVSWSRNDVDWSQFDAAIIRTTWDYFERFDEFRSVLEAIDAATRLLNPKPMLDWNMDKHYLADLGNAGVRVVPTAFLEVGESAASIDALLDYRGWDRAVIKPAVSGAARHTYAVEKGATEPSIIETVDRLLQNEAFLVQPFQDSIVEQGEKTIVVMGGKATHGILKRAKSGDFRVQDDHGGTVHDLEPSEQDLAFAARAMQAAQSLLGHRALYGRVDFVTDSAGLPALMELELVEPELWIRCAPHCAGPFAAQLRTLLDGA